MPTVTENSQPESRLRLFALLAVAHASLAFYLWLCAFDVNLVLTVRVWVALAWLWVAWPLLLVARGIRSVGRWSTGTSRPQATSLQA